MSPSARRIAALGAFIALLAVILGAFGAHALKSRLAPEQLVSFETGVRYQMYHAFALLILALLGEHLAGRAFKAVTLLFTLGTLLFSGSIYLLVLVGWKWLGPITPLGGLCLMTGWLVLGVALMRGRT